MEPQSSIEITRQAIALKKAGDTPGAVPFYCLSPMASANMLEY